MVEILLGDGFKVAARGIDKVLFNLELIAEVEGNLGRFERPELNKEFIKRNHSKYSKFCK